jgi:phosphoserine aminotransferase
VTDRVWNFSAGPATLPLPVLEQVRADLPSIPGVGASALEVSHRSPWFTGVLEEAVANLTELLGVPPGHHVVFCPGGATMQFSIVASTFLAHDGAVGDHVVTGAWGERALEEAGRLGRVRAAWSGRDTGFARVPTDHELARALAPSAAYAHVTTNETIHGVAFAADPSAPSGVPLVADASSDLLSRPIDVARYSVLYAGAQKNAGPAGVTIAIVRDDVLGQIPDRLPVLLDYRTYVDHGSLYNTPPVFAIYVVMLVTRWLRDEVGGLVPMLERNREKARLVYDVIDAHRDLYRGHAEAGSRSPMNVTFRLPTEELERRFVEEARAHGLHELRGHRSIGGIRASLYNAMPIEGASALAGFMERFAAATAR